jgi:hypothetical protein
MPKKALGSGWTLHKEWATASGLFAESNFGGAMYLRVLKRWLELGEKRACGNRQ